MPKKSTVEKAKRDAREGKSPSTQAGEFVHEEIDTIRAGKHGAKNAKQAIAIGLSKARRAGVKLPPPGKNASPETRKKARREEAGASRARTRKAAAPSRRRSRASTNALKRSGTSTRAASPRALSRQAKAASARKVRSSSTRRRPAKRRAHTRAKAAQQ